MAFKLPTITLTAVRADLDNDAVQVVINGTSYQGWQEIDIDSDILNPADAFSVSGTIPKAKPTGEEVRAGAPANGFDDFREGVKCDVYVGLDRQLAGVIDEVRMKGSRSGSTLKIAGRDRGAYLIDTEAKTHPQKSKYTIKSLIESMLEPAWNINVTLSNEDNRSVLLGKKDKKKPRAVSPTLLSPLARERTKIDPNQRIAWIIDTHCRRLGVTWWLTAGGDLFIGKPNYEQEAAYHFSAGLLGSKTTTNVEEWEVTRDITERFSEVKVIGQGWSDPRNIFDTTKPTPGKTATARDPDLVERGIVRKLIMRDSDTVTTGEVQSRADYEMGRRRLRGLVIKVTVPGFRQGDRLYAVDTMATVKIEEAGIDGTFYVVQRRFTENRGRRRTSLTLVQPKVWMA